jgi:hypothetical protein
MQFFNLFGQSQDDPTIVFPEPVTEETEVLPLYDIPVNYEVNEERIHDGVNPCGRYGCPCMTYGYGVPSLD